MDYALMREIRGSNDPGCERHCPAYGIDDPNVCRACLSKVMRRSPAPPLDNKRVAA